MKVLMEVLSLRPIICLLTDFGEEDYYVGAMKGVIYRICPEAIVVDISHQVRKFSVLDGAYVLYGSYKEFPEGTVFVVVVDPGVGTSRKAILVKTKRYFFIAPDNGVLSLVLEEEEVEEIYEIPTDFFVKNPSNTFHGRDVFAPAGAFAAKGDLSNFKPFKGELIKLEGIFSFSGGEEISGKYLHVDHFGNCATSIKYEKIRDLISYGDLLEVEGVGTVKFVKCFGDLDPGEAGVIANSIGILEVVVREGSASERFKISPGMTFRAKRLRIC